MSTSVTYPEVKDAPVAPQFSTEKPRRALEKTAVGRLVSLDAYRGFIMLLLVSEGFGFSVLTGCTSARFL